MYIGTIDGTTYGTYAFSDSLKDFRELTPVEEKKLAEDRKSGKRVVYKNLDGWELEDLPQPTQEELLQSELDDLQKYLDSTDWYAIRYADTGETIPEDVKTKRQKARERISEIRLNLEK